LSRDVHIGAFAFLATLYDSQKINVKCIAVTTMTVMNIPFIAVRIFFLSKIKPTVLTTNNIADTTIAGLLKITLRNVSFAPDDMPHLHSYLKYITARYVLAALFTHVYY
jgi:hypothetical protein